MSLSKDIFKAFLFSIKDILLGGYSYHAGSLTYHLLLTVAPLSIVLTTLASLSPFVDVAKIEAFLEENLPQMSATVVRELLSARERGQETSLLAVGLSYFFSINFVRTLGRALESVSEGVFGSVREVFLWLTMPLVLLVGASSVSLLFALSLYIKLRFPSLISFSQDLIYFLPLVVSITALYFIFLKKQEASKFIPPVALLVSITLVLAQSLFTWYLAHLFRGSILYGSLASVVAFLIWINLSFMILLWGSRLIYWLVYLRVRRGGDAEGTVDQKHLRGDQR